MSMSLTHLLIRSSCSLVPSMQNSQIARSLTPMAADSREKTNGRPETLHPLHQEEIAPPSEDTLVTFASVAPLVTSTTTYITELFAT